jgi:hypothetical protein
MTKDEALDLALEALDIVKIHFTQNRHVNEAITAIKQARALDKKADNARELGLDYEPVLKDNSNYRYDPPVAEPVQSCYCPNCEAMGKELAALKAQPAPVQEPVAWAMYQRGRLQSFWLDKGDAYDFEFTSEHEWKPLYTTPPAAPVPMPADWFAGMPDEYRKEALRIATQPAAQRQWVGLTDEEIFSVLGNLQRKYNGPPTEDSRVVFAQAIEAKLKEKNAAAQPAVPDAFGTREGEHPQYIQGWNDCRAEMLKGMKP